ncbi:MAG: hypothetical protein L0241_19570 [Planctomycetia bacterium]|nr:hypothetical protein [Planctomycetia bacterium]
MNVCELEINLGKAAMRCSTDEIETTFAWLLAEMRVVARLLRPDERERLRKIMSYDSRALTVRDVFPHFSRESEGHKTLRRLRAAQFVRPAKSGRWDPNEEIEIKPFARLVWDRLGESAIFADHEEQLSVVADETQAGEETPAVEETPAEEEAPVEVEQPVENLKLAEDSDSVPVGRHADWEKDIVDLLDYANEEVQQNR